MEHAVEFAKRAGSGLDQGQSLIKLPNPGGQPFHLSGQTGDRHLTILESLFHCRPRHFIIARLSLSAHWEKLVNICLRETNITGIFPVYHNVVPKILAIGKPCVNRFIIDLIKSGPAPTEIRSSPLVFDPTKRHSGVCFTVRPPRRIRGPGRYRDK